MSGGELKPCPKCGKPPKYDNCDHGSGKWYTCCGIQIKVRYGTPDAELETAWNAYAAPQAPSVPQGEGLREALAYAYDGGYDEALRWIRNETPEEGHRIMDREARVKESLAMLGEGAGSAIAELETRAGGLILLLDRILGAKPEDQLRLIEEIRDAREVFQIMRSTGSAIASPERSAQMREDVAKYLFLSHTGMLWEAADAQIRAPWYGKAENVLGIIAGRPHGLEAL